MRFLDTNIIIRYVTRDNEAKAEACFELFQRLKQGTEEVFTCEAIIAEVVYVLSSRRGPYRVDRDGIRARLAPILALRGLKVAEKGVYLRALQFYVSSPGLDFEDAIAMAHMERRGVRQILSYDKDFDGLVEVERVEP